MKPSAVAAALGIAESTIRKYASEYAEFLSPSGAGGSGKHRDFAEHDVRVLKLVRDMRGENASQEDIDVTLQSLKANNWERLPALDDNASAILPSPGALVTAQTEKSVMQREIELLREQLDREIELLRGQFDREIDRLESGAKTEIAKRDQRIIELERKLARTETFLDLYKSGELK